MHTEPPVSTLLDNTTTATSFHNRDISTSWCSPSWHHTSLKQLLSHGYYQKAHIQYLSRVLTLLLSLCLIHNSCPFLVHYLTVFIPVIGGVLFVFVIIALLQTSFTDPGILPRALPDEAADIERQIGEILIVVFIFLLFFILTFLLCMLILKLWVSLKIILDLQHTVHLPGLKRSL